MAKTVFEFVSYEFKPAENRIFFNYKQEFKNSPAIFFTETIILPKKVNLKEIPAGFLVIETGSAIIQFLSKKFRKKKIFLSSPIHHHLEAIGWPQYKITMRFWIVGIVLAIIGTAIRLLN